MHLTNRFEAKIDRMHAANGTTARHFRFRHSVKMQTTPASTAIRSRGTSGSVRSWVTVVLCEPKAVAPMNQMMATATTNFPRRDMRLTMACVGGLVSGEFPVLEFMVPIQDACDFVCVSQILTKDFFEFQIKPWLDHIQAVQTVPLHQRIMKSFV